MIINAGDKIIIHNLSHDSSGEVITADSTFEIKENMLILDNGYLCSTESINKDENGITIINVYEQDSLCVNGAYLYKSLSDCY